MCFFQKMMMISFCFLTFQTDVGAKLINFQLKLGRLRHIRLILLPRTWGPQTVPVEDDAYNTFWVDLRQNAAYIVDGLVVKHCPVQPCSSEMTSQNLKPMRKPNRSISDDFALCLSFVKTLFADFYSKRLEVAPVSKRDGV